MRFVFIIFFAIQPLFIWAQYDWVTFSNSGSLEDAINSIRIVNNEEIWVGTLDNGLQFFNGQNYTVFNTDNSPIPGNRVNDIILDSKNRKYIATNKGLAIYDDKSWTIYTSDNSNLPGNTVISLVVEEQGRIWYGTNAGVVMDLFGKVFNSSNSGLPGDQILDMFIDPEGIIWFATENGIANYDGSTWTSHISGTGILPPGAVKAIEIDKNNNLWASFIIGSDGALMVFDGTEWKLIETENNIFQAVGVYDIISTEKGEVWFGTHHKGLMKYDGNKFEHFLNENCDIPINQILSLAVDSDNNVWLGSRKGLTKVVSYPTSILVTGKESHDILVNPNPFKEYTRISVPEHITGPFSFTLYNTHGQQVKIITEIQSKSFTLQNDDLQPGFYFFKILSGSAFLTGSLVVTE